MDILFESALRITVLAGAVAAALRLLRGASPRSAHRAWTGVCVVMLALPAIVAWAPEAMVPILPARVEVVAAQPSPSRGDMPPIDSMTAATIIEPGAVSWTAIGAVAYAGGVLLLLSGLALGCWQGRTMIRQAKVVRGRLTHPRCVTPVTVGLWSPVVILPPDWVEWDERDVAAVLAHEEEHARRRDPLVTCVTLINRAVFWFHPLAWWLRGEIAMLSEQACDAVVLSRGHEAERYASALLRFARAVAAAGGRVAPLVTAVTGAGLPARLALLHAPSAPAVSASRTVCTTLTYVAVVAICAASTPTRAQSSPDGGAQPAASWQTYTSEHFDILHTADQQHRLEDVAYGAEQAYVRLAAALRHELAARVPLILVGRDRDLQDGAAAVQELMRRTGARRGQRIVMSIETLDARTDAIVHELAHQFTFEIVPDISRTAPWLMEGLAEHERGAWDARNVERIRRAVRSSGVPDPAALTDADAHWAQALFDYISARSGEEGIRRFLFALRTSTEVAEAIQAAFGVAPDAFARAFAGYVNGRFGAQ